MIQLEIGQALILYSGILLVLAAGIWLYTEISAWRSHRTLGKQYLWRVSSAVQLSGRAGGDPIGSVRVARA